ncbi:TadE/TadG family type IV pilus assembly protein [Nocardioides sp. cx-173]|uniref:TadE/TadG family type IV pilus assembly protein n=1 Tax=Nocardioides sp. cx-173 TaxID=2898796 RepID=UPI001E623718|nr:TadE/TadG family type IV pilus assembly protein [Nocardioides sp. cx-173]MCD4525255.1 pilus assembly protein [Nocardioides sp. cx-173]UGB40943.1 pilus assembly protein [Nocardioides sp. cx-173]
MLARLRERSQRGAAVVDFVLVLLVLVPLFLGILQVALVLLVRNSLAAAASEGARLAATADRGPGEGAALTREQVEAAIAGRYAEDVTVRRVMVDGAATIEVTIHARVPALGIGGPSVALDVSGHAVEEAP